MGLDRSVIWNLHPEPLFLFSLPAYRVLVDARYLRGAHNNVE